MKRCYLLAALLVVGFVLVAPGKSQACDVAYFAAPVYQPAYLQPVIAPYAVQYAAPLVQRVQVQKVKILRQRVVVPRRQVVRQRIVVR